MAQLHTLLPRAIFPDERTCSSCWKHKAQGNANSGTSSGPGTEWDEGAVLVFLDSHPKGDFREVGGPARIPTQQTGIRAYAKQFEHSHERSPQAKNPFKLQAGTPMEELDIPAPPLPHRLQAYTKCLWHSTKGIKVDNA
eukprot:1145397-Pelagomonas_calceolata.AAC.4